MQPRILRNPPQKEAPVFYFCFYTYGTQKRKTRKVACATLCAASCSTVGRRVLSDGASARGGLLGLGILVQSLLGLRVRVWDAKFKVWDFEFRIWFRM